MRRSQFTRDSCIYCECLCVTGCQEVLDRAPGVMWMDAAFRLQTGQLQPVYDLAIQNGGVAQFFGSPHSVYAATHPAMWRYLVTDPERLKSTHMFGANSLLLYRTEKVYKGIVYWWTLCALDVECIAPTSSNKTCPPQPDMNTFHLEGCHRQDQSALGTIVANLYNFNVTNYVPSHSGSFVKLYGKSTYVKGPEDAAICS